MERKEHDKITAFDSLFTTNHIQILKIVMPYLDTPMRKKMAVYIKYLELQYTLSYYSSHSVELCGCSIHPTNSAEKEEFNLSKLCSEILPYCTAREKQSIEQISGMFRSVEMYQEISRTFEMMKNFAPDNGGGEDGMMNTLLSMLSPEQKSMFEMFDMFGGNPHEPE